MPHDNKDKPKQPGGSLGRWPEREQRRHDRRKHHHHDHSDPAVEQKLDRLTHLLTEGFKAMATRDQELLDAIKGLSDDVAALGTTITKLDADVTKLTDAVTNAQQPDGSVTPAGAQAILDAAAAVKVSLAGVKSAADAVDARTPDA